MIIYYELQRISENISNPNLWLKRINMQLKEIHVIHQQKQLK